MDKSQTTVAKSIDSYNTSLDNQISYLETLAGVTKLPVVLAILGSLKELRALNKSKYEKKTQYSGRHKITKEFFEDIENADELLAKKVIVSLLENIPLETLKKFFNYEVLDPNSERSKDIMADRKADSSLKYKILRLKEERSFEVSAYIEI